MIRRGKQPETLKWHFQKSVEYGFAGWWVWACQDTPTATTGICDLAGNWKRDLVQIIKQQRANPSNP